MLMLVCSLAGCLLGWLATRLFKWDEIETIASISFATFGSWLGTGAMLRFLRIPFGTTASPECILAGCVTAIIGIAIYKIAFHPHSTHHNWPRMFH